MFSPSSSLGILAFRWLKAKMLWRLRNRLIVTYVFIGVIPVVLLVAMAFITIYLFAGQFANFVVTSELDSRLRSLHSVNAAIAHELAARLEHGQPAIAESLEGLKRTDRAWASRQICAWKNGRPWPCAPPPLPERLLRAAVFSDPGLRERSSGTRASCIYGLARTRGGQPKAFCRLQ